MADFVDMVLYLQSIGLLDVLLPFFLTFAIVFAIFQKTKILGSGKGVKRFNVIVAVAMAFAVVVPHIVYGTPNPVDGQLVTGFPDAVEIINNALPQVSIVIIAIILLLLLIGAFGVEWKLSDTGAGSLIPIAALGIVIYIFAVSAGWLPQYPPWLYWMYNPETSSLIVTLLVFGAIVYFITKEPKDDDDNKDPLSKRLQNWVQVKDINEK